MPEVARLRVSVVYAEAGGAFEVELELPAGATAGGAIEASRLRECRPDVEIRADHVGIFGRKVALDTPLRDGDRVEIYRPLRIDPKEARRRRAEGADSVSGRRSSPSAKDAKGSHGNERTRC